MADLLMASDIGATNTRLRLVSAGDLATALFEQTYRDFAVLDAIGEFLRQIDEHRAQLRAAGFGVAGRVIDGDVRMTNRPSEKVTDELLARALGLSAQRIVVVNDMVAHLSGVQHSDTIVLRAGRPAGTVEGIIMPGTGLGVGYAIRDERGRRVAMPSEGGHLDFGPTDRDHEQLQSWARRRTTERISWEWFVSGPGLGRIYRYLREQSGKPEGSEDVTPEQVTAAALGQPGELDPATAARAARMFLELAGARAGNLCLDVLATSSVYLGGNLLNLFFEAEAESFRMAISSAFDACGPEVLRQMMRDVPLHLLRSPDSGLRGAAALAAERI